MVRDIVFALPALAAMFGTPPVGASQPIEALTAELIRMLDADQTGRAKITEAGGVHGFESPQVKALWDEQSKRDAENLSRLEEIVKQHGWPGRSLVGPQAAAAAFLIVQHADYEVQLRYLPVIKTAVQRGELDGQAFALLQDRILVREGKKQLYGTQFDRNPQTGALNPFPIEDEANVDARRSELGMESLAEYAKRIRD